MSAPSLPMTLDEIKAYIDEYNASRPPGSPHVIMQVVTSPTDPAWTPTSQAAVVQRQIRLSLGLPPVPEAKPTMPVEGHVCEFPLWAFSKQRSTITELHILYDDGSFLTIEAPKGMPSPRFPGYLDVILFYGQRDLFLQDHTSISVYSIFQALGMDPQNNWNYADFSDT